MGPDHLPDGSGSDRNSDDAWLEAWLGASWRRWRLWVAARGLAIGVGLAGVTTALLEGEVPTAGLVAGVLGVLGTCLTLMGAEDLRDIRFLLAATERAHPDLRNALVAWEETRTRVPPRVRIRLAAHARHVLGAGGVVRPGSRGGWAAVLGFLALGVVAALIAVPARRAPAEVRRVQEMAAADAAGVTLRWTVAVLPPRYTGRQAFRVEQPSSLEVLAGSRLEVTFTGWPRDAKARLGDMPLELRGAPAAIVANLTAVESDVLLVEDTGGAVRAAVTLVVVPDDAPGVRVTAPGADLRRASASGTVEIRLAARDDIGLRDLRLRFTRVSGSGESFTFEDGEWPVRVRRLSPTEWAGDYTLDLATLGLGPGDTVAYRAVAHDARPGPEGASESEQFLIEIARPGAVAAGDFSLPDPEERFALSQRMVIQLTERLLERQARMSTEEFRQESQVLAIAQRRVRAEFVFMLGGEVEDEFEEAAHSHEVEAGRLDNRGQNDLTVAVREMSQAETRLTDARVRDALTFEYRALQALQAAFGKARYFMRTLPAPVQIDTGRRLQGDREQASSSRWELLTPVTRRAAGLALLQQLEAPGVSLGRLLPELVALDRADAAWVAEVRRAAEDGPERVARVLRARLLPGSPRWMPLPLPRGEREAATARDGTARTP